LTVCPPQFLQALPECRNASFPFGVILSRTHEDTDPRHPRALLRPRCNRPRDRRAAYKSNELASLHRRPQAQNEPS
jgi:hypothetical protein